MAKAEKRSGAYSVRVSLTDPATGERTQKRVTARTKRELDVKVADLKAKWHSGTYLEPSREPLSSYLEHFIDTADLAPNTRKAYRSVTRRLIVPHVGAVPLGKLTGRHVQDLYNAARETTYGAQVQAVMSGALRLAVREGLTLRNVADGLIVGRTERDAPDVPLAWTAADLAAFLAGVRSHWLWPLYWTAAHTGMRLSELVELPDGVPPHVVQARLGHASSRTTLDVYAHVLPVSERDVADRFAAVLTAGSDQIVTIPAGEGPESASA